MALAGMATRKQREKRELELRQMQEEASTGGATKEESILHAKKVAKQALKKQILGEQIQRQYRLAKQREALALRKKETPTEYPKDFDYDQYPDNDEGGPVEHSGEAYNGICLGMVFMCIGSSFMFVGHGSKGFQTIQLKMIGPILCVIGFAFFTVNIVHLSFPNLFKASTCTRNTKLRDSGQSNLTKRRLQNGHFGKRVTSPKARSPRVTLHSSKKPSKSTAQNNSYSEDENTSDDDDFDLTQSHPENPKGHNSDDFQHSLTNSGKTSPGNTPKLCRSTITSTPIIMVKPLSDFQQATPQPCNKIDKNENKNPQGLPHANSELMLSPEGLI